MSSSCLKRLKVQENLLNSACETAVHSIKHNDTDNLIQTLESKRKQDEKALYESYEEITESLKYLSGNISSKEKIKNLDVEYCRKYINELEKQMTNLKQELEAEAVKLKCNENQLNDEVDMLQKMTLNNENNTSRVYRSLQSSSVKVIKQTRSIENEDVKNFQDFLLQSGGHTGGWGEEEHKIFLKYWEKYQMKDNLHRNAKGEMLKKKFINALHELLPDFSCEEIMAHATWLLAYKHLKTLQFIALEHWKSLRQVDHHKINFDVVTNTKEWRVNYSACAKQQLEAWKQNKNDEKQIMNDLKVVNILVDKELVFTKTGSLQAERDSINKWTESKQMEMATKLLNEKTLLAREKDKRAAKANKKIKEFRERDDKNLKQKKDEVQKRKSLNEVKQKDKNIFKSSRLNKCRLITRYDSPTEQWCRRILRKRSSDSNLTLNGCIPNRIENIQKLGIPEWRDGLSIR